MQTNAEGYNFIQFQIKLSITKDLTAKFKCERRHYDPNELERRIPIQFNPITDHNIYIAYEKVLHMWCYTRKGAISKKLTTY